MSYILEALKKVDRERGIGGVPRITTPPEVRRPQVRSTRWLWIVVALLSVNAILVFVLLTDRDAGDATAPVPAQVPAERETAPAAQPLEQSVQQAGEIPAAGAPVPEKPIAPESQPAPSGSALVVLPEPAQSGGELVVLPEPPYSRNPETSILPEGTSDSRTDDEAIAQADSQWQSWYELPQSIRNNIDLPRLDVHVYSKDPAKRFIMVNLQKFREGERLPSGLVVEEILPDGMVLSYQGERFRVDK